MLSTTAYLPGYCEELFQAVSYVIPLFSCRFSHILCIVFPVLIFTFSFFDLLISELFMFSILGYPDNIFSEQAQLESDKSVGFGCGWYAAQRSCPPNQIPSFPFLVCFFFILTGSFSYSFFFFIMFSFFYFFHLVVEIERENCGSN